MSQRQVRGRRKKTDDRVPPTGRWVNRTPRPGTEVSGTIHLDLLASDNRGMSNVTFYVNGQSAGTLILEASSTDNLYSKEVNTRSWANGTYNISAYLGADDGPGMTKNLGSLTFSNATRPSLAITSHVNNDEVTLPFTITVEVSPAGESYETPQLDGNGEIESSPTEVSANVWTFPISSFYDGSETITVSPFMFLTGETSQRVYGDAVVLENGSYYSAVSVTYAISSVETVVGSTVTFTPTITGDSRDITIRYNVDGDFDWDYVNVGNSEAGVGAEVPVEHVYLTPSTATAVVEVSRDGSILQTDTLTPIVITANPASDTTAPVLTITSPTVGATVSGTLTVNYSGTDAVGVTLVTPSYNGALWQTIQVSAGTTITATDTFDTTVLADGSLTIGGTAHDAAGNPGTAATVVVTIDNVPDTPPPQVDDWYDWAADAASLVVTETRKNLSDATKVSPPISALITFHPGEITTSHWFTASRDGSGLATNEWQLGERSTFPDGSLRSAVLRCFGPVSMADNATTQITLTKTAGAWPAETDGRAISLVINANDFWIELADITLPENRPDHNYASRQAQQAYTYPTLEFRLQRAMASGRARLVTAGNVFSQWVVWEKLRTPDGVSADGTLWCKCWVDTWYTPGTNTVAHQAVHPLVINGRATAVAKAKLAKVRAMNGATELVNYSKQITLTMADWNFLSAANEWEFTDASTDFTVVDVRLGDGVKFGGTLPSNFTSGGLYCTTVTQDYGVSRSQKYLEYRQIPGMGIGHYGRWGFTGGAYPTGGNNLAPGTGGGTHTMTTYTLFADKTMHAIRDAHAVELWTVGGAVIEPAWTRAEKLRRARTGQIPSICFDDINSFQGTWQGLTSNYPKNTGLRLAYRRLHNFAPGRNLHHRTSLDWSGTYTEAGFHLNECSVWTYDLLNDMANDTSDFWLRQRQAAAEAISFDGINCYTSSLDSGGNEYPEVQVADNGPAKDGVPYPNMGPCFPDSIRGNSAYVKEYGAGTGAEQENEIKIAGTYSGRSGSHEAKEFAFGYVLRCLPQDLEATKHLWASCNSQTAGSPAYPTYNRIKTQGGVTYYNVISAPAMATRHGQPRHNIGKAYYLSFLAYIADSEPDALYFRNAITSSVDWASAFVQDTNYVSDISRKMGVAMSLPLGADQSWVLGRILTANIYLLKRSGKTGANAVTYLKYLTAMSRLIHGAPEGGGSAWTQATGDCWNGYDGVIAAVQLYDNAADTSGVEHDPSSTDTRNLTWRLHGNAATSTDPSANFTYLMRTINNASHTLNNSVWNWTGIGGPNAALLVPQEGDWVIFYRNAGTVALPNEITPFQKYYPYNISGSTAWLSSTPGPSWTRVTWTGNYSATVTSCALWYATKRVGPHAGGLFTIRPGGQTNPEYVLESTGPMVAAKTMFGAEHLDAALAKYATMRGYIQTGLGHNLLEWSNGNVLSTYAWKPYAPSDT